MKHFTITFTVERTPDEAYAAIVDVRAWWSGNIEGRTDVVGEEFTYRYEDLHVSRQRVTELVPGQRVVWEVLDSTLAFVDDQHEWNGTKVEFEITKKGAETQVRFTHVGLGPDQECYAACSRGWRTYIQGSLRSLIEHGRGQPNPAER